MIKLLKMFNKNYLTITGTVFLVFSIIELANHGERFWTFSITSIALNALHRIEIALQDLKK
jgi:hypothetical protein|tara:strand:+ start:5880 stop:6062 length:183 start_codon:yes stop_codon:yes gene_type:complete